MLLVLGVGGGVEGLGLCDKGSSTWDDSVDMEKVVTFLHLFIGLSDLTLIFLGLVAFLCTEY